MKGEKEGRRGEEGRRGGEKRREERRRRGRKEGKRRRGGEDGEINCDSLEKLHYYVASCSVDTTCVHRQEPKL